MSITVKQAWTGVGLALDQGLGSNPTSSATVPYIVEGTEDDITACTSAYEFAPDEFSEIPKKSASVAERLTDTAWKIEVNYGSESKSSSGDSGDESDEATMNFDCSAGTKHMTQAIEQTCVYAGSGESKDSTDEASAVPIGWNGKDGSESEAAGVDVSIGELRETSEFDFESLPPVFNARCKADFPENGSIWQRRVRRTFEYLEGRGLHLTHNYESHTPQRFPTRKLLRAMRNVDYLSGIGYTINTLFCGLLGITGGFDQALFKRTCETETAGKDAKLSRILCGYNDRAFSGGLRARLFKLFPKKSKYEKEL